MWGWPYIKQVKMLKSSLPKTPNPVIQRLLADYNTKNSYYNLSQYRRYFAEPLSTWL